MRCLYDTLRLKIYVHGPRDIMFYCGLLAFLVDLTHALQVYFAGAWVIIRLYMVIVSVLVKQP